MDKFFGGKPIYDGNLPNRVEKSSKEFWLMDGCRYPISDRVLRALQEKDCHNSPIHRILKKAQPEKITPHHKEQIIFIYAGFLFYPF